MCHTPRLDNDEHELIEERARRMARYGDRLPWRCLPNADRRVWEARTELELCQE